MQVLHCSSAEDDKEAHPEGGTLKGNRFVGFTLLLFILIGLEDDGIQEQRQEAQDQDQLDAEDPEVLRWFCNPWPVCETKIWLT